VYTRFDYDYLEFYDNVVYLLQAIIYLLCNCMLRSVGQYIYVCIYDSLGILGNYEGRSLLALEASDLDLAAKYASNCGLGMDIISEASPAAPG